MLRQVHLTKTKRTFKFFRKTGLLLLETSKARVGLHLRNFPLEVSATRDELISKTELRGQDNGLAFHLSIRGTGTEDVIVEAMRRWKLDQMTDEMAVWIIDNCAASDRVGNSDATATIRLVVLLDLLSFVSMDRLARHRRHLDQNVDIRDLVGSVRVISACRLCTNGARVLVRKLNVEPVAEALVAVLMISESCDEERLVVHFREHQCLMGDSDIFCS